MSTNVISLFKQNIENNPNDKITEILSEYTEKIINEDKSISCIDISTTYFLENDKWNIDFFRNIEQFKIQAGKYCGSRKNISFVFTNENVKKEIKLLVYNKLFSSE